MPATNFFIDRSTGRKRIRSSVSGLSVKVFNLQEEPFTARYGALTFFADIHGSLAAFVAESGPEAATELPAALNWYADHAGFPIVNFTINDPRQRALMRIV